MNFVNDIPFINRDAEIKFLKDWLARKPNKILFLYGPKSGGKTTLLNRFIEMADNGRTEFRILNLREIFVSGYGDFLKAFFGVSPDGETKEVKLRTEYGLKPFMLKREVVKGLEKKTLDPFQVMKKELEKLNKKGRLPVLILDELQALEDIYFNGQRLLIKELFNFFVAMTKESHLCHVLICGSDGYFMERIYNDSRLRKTSDFFKVDYLTKADVTYWLDNLEKESRIKTYVLDAGQREAVWETFGGSMWEISEFLGDLLSYAEDGGVSQEHFTGIIEKRKIQMRSHFEDYVGMSLAKEKLCISMYGEMRQKGFFKHKDFQCLLSPELFSDESLIRDELRRLVSNNFIAYDPLTAQYTMQGKSMEHGLRMYNEMRR